MLSAIGRYRKYLESNPNVSFAEYTATRMLNSLGKGRSLPQIGPNLTEWEDWTESGLVQFTKYSRWFPISADSKVVDYGCGTLRIGFHFIEYLNRGGYFPDCDISEHLDVGRDMVGVDMLTEKAARLAVVQDQAIVDAAAFRPDWVFSHSVCSHVHPDEANLYFSNLVRIAHKPGATLWFDAPISDRPLIDRNLSWPLERYVEALRPLEFVGLRGGHSQVEEGQTIRKANLVFARR